MTMAEVLRGIEVEREDDGRWIADITTLPGVMCYGATREEAIEAAQDLARRVLDESDEQATCLAV